VNFDGARLPVMNDLQRNALAFRQRTARRDDDEIAYGHSRRGKWRACIEASDPMRCLRAKLAPCAT
jgi:hypothetical protein